MNNFTFHNPTRLLFGKGMIEKLSTTIPMVHRIMIFNNHVGSFLRH